MNNKDINLLHQLTVRPIKYQVHEQHLPILNSMMRLVLNNKRPTRRQMAILNKYK
jgi:hypothetical protein